MTPIDLAWITPNVAIKCRFEKLSCSCVLLFVLLFVLDKPSTAAIIRAEMES